METTVAVLVAVCCVLLVLVVAAFGAFCFLHRQRARSNLIHIQTGDLEAGNVNMVDFENALAAQRSPPRTKPPPAPQHMETPEPLAAASAAEDETEGEASREQTPIATPAPPQQSTTNPLTDLNREINRGLLGAPLPDAHPKILPEKTPSPVQFPPEEVRVLDPILPPLASPRETTLGTQKECVQTPNEIHDLPRECNEAAEYMAARAANNCTPIRRMPTTVAVPVPSVHTTALHHGNLTKRDSITIIDDSSDYEDRALQRALESAHNTAPPQPQPHVVRTPVEASASGPLGAVSGVRGVSHAVPTFNISVGQNRVNLHKVIESDTPREGGPIIRDLEGSVMRGGSGIAPRHPTPSRSGATTPTNTSRPPLSLHTPRGRAATLPRSVPSSPHIGSVGSAYGMKSPGPSREKGSIYSAASGARFAGSVLNNVNINNASSTMLGQMHSGKRQFDNVQTISHSISQDILEASAGGRPSSGVGSTIENMHIVPSPVLAADGSVVRTPGAGLGSLLRKNPFHFSMLVSDWERRAGRDALPSPHPIPASIIDEKIGSIHATVSTEEWHLLDEANRLREGHDASYWSAFLGEVERLKKHPQPAFR